MTEDKYANLRRWFAGDDSSLSPTAQWKLVEDLLSEYDNLREALEKFAYLYSNDCAEDLQKWIRKTARVALSGNVPSPEGER